MSSAEPDSHLTLLDRCSVSDSALLDVLCDVIFQSFRGVIPFDRLSVALLEGEPVEVRLRWQRSILAGGGLPLGYSLPLSATTLGQLIRGGSPRIINDLQAYHELHPESLSTQMMVEQGVRSSLTCPLILRGQTAGFLFFSSCQHSTYLDAHVERFSRLAGQLAFIIEQIRLYEELDRERLRNDQLLRELMPDRIVDQLQAGHKPQPELHPECSVLMADLVGFTARCQSCSPQWLQRLLDDLYEALDQQTQALGVTKIGTIGDGYLAVAGVPEAQADHAARAARLAQSIHHTLESFAWPDGSPVQARVGIFVGPVIAGLAGRQARRFDIWGHTVNMASRLQVEATPGRTLACERVGALVADSFHVEPAGRRSLKGVGEIETVWIGDD